jgi:hypothetical protein
MVVTEQFTEAEIFEALQLTFEEWKGGRRSFTFEAVREMTDETMVMTREQFDQFVSELGISRCEYCGSEGGPLCENDVDSLDKAMAADAFDRARKGE